jgi:pyridinium-3,5-bisthiocarboxylic acid mononucleotide nickel chelatase
MKICYLDAFSGISGDMTVGALIDAGADSGAVVLALDQLGTGAKFTIEKTKRCGITASKFRVIGGKATGHRHLKNILELIDTSALPGSVKQAASAVFQRLGEAEAKVHDISIDKVHFHEVGAVDSISDIVGACLALHLLGIDKIYCSQVNVGSGTVNTEHGILPVPAPATARLLQGHPIYSRGPAMELTTPTGAAFVAALAESFGAMPPMRVKSIGYGAGDRDFSEHANVVRVMVGEPSGALESTTVSVIEANIDDASPQVVAYAIEKLLEAGALDAVVIPAQMKKGRAGMLVQVIAAPEKREELIAVMFRETTTLGVRFNSAERRVQPREWIEVLTKHGIVRVKASQEGFAPEYEDARRVAAESGIPLKQVLAETCYEYLKITN